MMLLSRFKNKFNIVNWLKKLTNTNTQQISLGRWSNENKKKTNLKIDYANEDHCGVCTNLVKNKNENKNENKKL
jgi:hypothetical protein